MSKSDNWYDIRHVDQIDSPALIIYPDRVKKNIRILKSMIEDPNRLRPHVKTHKTKEATLLLMDAGINKFKCATISEAEMLGMCNAKDVLLAYQPFGPKLQRFIKLVRQYPDTNYSCLIDNLNSAKGMSKVALNNNMNIVVFIDLNVGMDRTGIKPGKKALKLFEDCVNLKGIKLVGFHAYDGHIREKSMQKRIIICNKSFAPVKAMMQELIKRGYKEPNLVIGGSQTFPIYAKYKNLECSPGTFIFWDKGYQDSLPEQHFFPAALIITRVISLPGKTKLCLDMGYKSIAAENDINHRLYFLNGSGLKIVSQSEEHLVVEAGERHSWEIGDILYALPVHVCPTVALYENATVIGKGEVIGNWKIIARDRKINI